MLRSAAILLACLTISSAQPEELVIAELQQTISEIVETKSLESQETNAWETEKQELATLRQLHTKELALLKEELAASGTSAPEHLETTKTLEEEIANLRAARQKITQTLATAVPRTLALAKSFPKPLQEEISTETANLTARQASDEPREALQNVLSILEKARLFNRKLTRTTEIREKRSVQVLYLGLSQAFFADRENLAGIGRPSPEGWTWETRPDLHPEITKTFSILDEKQVPAMVNLPLQIQE